MKKPKGMGPGPKLKPVNNVHSISKSQALSTVETMKTRLTSMLMLLGAVCRRHGPQTFTRYEVEFTNPAQLHIRDDSEHIQTWWGVTQAPMPPNQPTSLDEARSVARAFAKLQYEASAIDPDAEKLLLIVESWDERERDDDGDDDDAG